MRPVVQSSQGNASPKSHPGKSRSRQDSGVKPPAPQDATPPDQQQAHHLKSKGSRGAVDSAVKMPSSSEIAMPKSLFPSARKTEPQADRPKPKARRGLDIEIAELPVAKRRPPVDPFAFDEDDD